MELSSQTTNNVTGFQKIIPYVEGYSWLREGWSAHEEQAKVSLLPQRPVNISNMPSSGSRSRLR